MKNELCSVCTAYETKPAGINKMKIEIHDEIESSISGLLTRQGCLRQDKTIFLFVGLGERM